MRTAFDVLGKDSFPINKCRGEYAGPCPWCGGKDRFVVLTRESTDRGGRFFCRQCGRSGDGIQLLREALGMGYAEACDTLGIQPKTYSTTTNFSPARHQAYAAATAGTAGSSPKPFIPTERQMPPSAWRNAAFSLLESLRGSLRTADARALLEKRGLTVETAEAKGLAFNPVDRFEPPEHWGITVQGKICIPEGLVLPTFDDDGQPLSLLVRRTDAAIQRTAAYYASKGIQWDTKSLRFHEIKGSTDVPTIFGAGGGPIIIFESFLDALLVYQESRGLCATLALNGATKMPDAPCMDALRAAPLVLLSLDLDTEGKAAMRQWQRQIFPSAMLWTSLSGKDVGDMARTDIYSWIVAGLMKHGYRKITSETGNAGAKTGADTFPRQPRPTLQCEHCQPASFQLS